jgi:hypothetical protein
MIVSPLMGKARWFDNYLSCSESDLTDTVRSD